VKKAASIKPKKKTDAELFEFLAKNIRNGNYIFLTHAKIRLKDRMISDIEVIDILEGKIGRKRKRNKAKDKYEDGYQDWNYCIEGINLDGEKIRIIFSFVDDFMPIITVIRLDA